MDKTTTTKVIQKLVDMLYISKKRDDIDKRMWRLYPEKKGLEIYAFVIHAENTYIETCFHNFTEEEKKLVLQLVKKMRENIESDWKEIKRF